MTDEELESLHGRRTEGEEIEQLLRSYPHFDQRLLDVWATLPLIGLGFALGDDEDESGMGAELQWMSPSQALDESHYPGIAAVQLGYWPFGICLEGSGDPYFLRSTDGKAHRWRP